MNKKYIIEILKKLINADNESYIKYLLRSLDEISDEELIVKLKQLNISEENIEQSLDILIKKHIPQEKKSEKFICVNELFCYGITENTLHMHIIPKDLRPLKKEIGDKNFYRYYKEQLADFLSKIQTIFSEDTTFNLLFAVSPIFYNTNITSIHENLGFEKITEIDLNNKNDSMNNNHKKYFLNMFGNNKRVYYTSITREKLMRMNYSQIFENKTHSKL